MVDKSFAAQLTSPHQSERTVWLICKAAEMLSGKYPTKYIDDRALCYAVFEAAVCGALPIKSTSAPAFNELVNDLRITVEVMQIGVITKQCP